MYLSHVYVMPSMYYGIYDSIDLWNIAQTLYIEGVSDTTTFVGVRHLYDSTPVNDYIQ
jgi:hypothetical protein